ncbi:N-terminal Xaa-Pro-Lys N-methyltransferase 1-like [Ornithodoros turicata]|uniref:N-terminal Xaa-Pro-Lys N-methyltransferase 1-like n=1 Tax=Ornithodoros turicata TaxID=34597 RepID=UPI003138FBD3
MGSAEYNGDFYSQGKAYWENIPATVDGMLGGYSHLSSIDIHSSLRFLNTFLTSKEQPTGKQRALDCGAGIGRITKHLLLRCFETVDMVEQNATFLDQAREYIGAEASRVDQLYCSGLQDFVPESEKYDVIWCQWVTGYLTDDDFVSFLRRCKSGLRPAGILVVKDNVTSESVHEDDADGGVTRPREMLVRIFNRAGLEVVAERRQYKFPKGIYEVRMFALR